ncbi:MAG TPA: 16S rRNA (cytosine(1402)-N(4))-methyltransferase RsmH [Candidatus Paceibacterota bacterium]|jgi:16S rRNA (cytosine1402-N4)-methyltransferase|nr:16S rRNA (cytosine(1402)-N(4))-methyltransferase RsmH [Candidatus Paceibacterota bacterium]
MKSAVSHISVLLHESVDSLSVQPNDIIVDGTFGGGGHSTVLYDLIPKGTLICVDLDEGAQQRFADLFKGKNHAIFVHSNFKDATTIISAANVNGVDKVLLDLGTSTFQLLDDTRGFSFQSDTPLAMTFSEQGSHTGFNAYDIVNSWQEESIANVIYGYGEEPKSRKIAKAIIEARAHGPIATSAQLADIISTAIPRRGRIHPATKTFQALRIAVNDELGTLEESLNAWWNVLNTHGRISIITFHSLEDRIVKQWMKNQSQGRVITKKPTPPSQEELSTNPRSRSAKLRTIEKL